jgi:hypothetical protein
MNAKHIATSPTITANVKLSINQNCLGPVPYHESLNLKAARLVGILHAKFRLAFSEFVL